MAEPVTVYQKTKKAWGWLFTFTAWAIFMFTMGRYIWHKTKEGEAKLAAAAAASAKAKLSTLEKEAREKARAEEADRKFMAAKNQAFMNCRDQGHIPMMGFGFKVICVRAEAIAWEQKLEDGQPPPW